MGVRGFLSYVKRKIPLIRPLESPPQRIGLDTHGLLYIWQDNLVGLMNFLQAFQAAGHTLTFVFDGEAPAEKKGILAQKRQNREHASLQAHALTQFLATEEGKALDEKSRQHLERQIQGLKASTWCITPAYRETVIQRLQAANCHLIFAKGEADTELVGLERERKIDVIMSSDMDFVRFGVNRIWIPKFRDTSYECFDLDIGILCDEEDIPIEALADIATLCGSEYEYSAITPTEAFGLMRYYGSLKNLAARRPEFGRFLNTQASPLPS
jgi:5'-3' exonuclease